MRNFVARFRVWLWWVCIAGATVFAAAPMARADGKVMPPLLVPQEVTMPDQRALLAWRDGVETLVIESAFVGRGTDFAWVVPLPSKPEVEPATRGTLASVAALMQPVVIPPAGELWWMIAGLVVLASWTLAFGWKSEGTFLLFLIGLMALILLPTVGKVRSSVGPVYEADGVRVERGIVGDFDVSLVSGREGDGVVGWLRDNGYAIDAEAAKVAAEHAAAGGWFVASRVRREFAESGRSVPAPLLFRFATAKPLYPMRLTGAGATEALKLELFVFGPERAVAEGLEAVAWGPVRVGDPAEGSYRRGFGQPRDARVVTHPVLARLAEGAAVVTHLRGTLAPAQMRADMRPRWEAGGEAAHGLVAWARETAWQAAVAAGGGLLLVLLIWLGFRHGGRRPPWRWSTAALVAGAATGGAVFAALPSVATREMHGGKSIPWYAVRQVPQVAALALWELDPATTSDDAARAAFAAEFRKFLDASDWEMEIGDGPGQVELVKTPEGKWRAILYDAAGQARFRPEEDFELGGVKTKSPAR